MAKKKAAMAGGDKQIKIAIDSSEEAPVYYANYMEVAHSNHDFTIAAVRVPTKLPLDRLRTAQENGGSYHLEAAVVLVLAPTVIPGLIMALSAQQAAYEKRFGKISEEPSTLNVRSEAQ